MKVPLSWLSELVDITLPLDELVHRLNMSGTEVEEVLEVGSDWERIYVSRVVELKQHPNADTLFVARLDVGSEGTATAVTGATNLTVGAVVPIVRPGGRLRGGREIGVSDLRGVRSEGMLCSGAELGLSPDRSGIYLLDSDGHVGRPLRELFGDTVLDLYITPNRSDCMSVFGVAREVHAITGAPLRRIKTGLPRGERSAADFVKVEIADPDLCRRFTAAYVSGVTMGPSPLWMQRRLHLAGVRPISNVVDMTNYTMLELGQPQHVFDADRLGGQIVVRRAKGGESIVTLDGVERQLGGETLVIADASNAVAVAGVMGGLATEVHDGTRNVVLETANFLPTSIRRTARELRLPSEASRRYERGLNPDMAMVAAERTVELLVEHCGGTATAGIVDVYPGRSEPRRIPLDEDQIAALLGQRYSREEITRVLTALDFAVEPRGEGLTVTVPGHRLDVEGKADLAEEVARIAGYDAIPDTLPTGSPSEPHVDPLREVAEHARDVLVGCGLQEVMTYSLVAPGSESRLTGSEQEVGVPIWNSLSADQSVLRTSLAPSLIDTARNNLRHRGRVAIFEIARVYLPPMDPLPTEPVQLGIVLVGEAEPQSWNRPARQVDFFDLKGAIDGLMNGFGVTWRAKTAEGVGYHPGRCAEIDIESDGLLAERIGMFGQLHPRTAERFDLRGREVYVAELDLQRLAGHVRGQPQIAAIPRFPALDRDLALLLERAVSHEEVEGALREAGGELLIEVSLFDEYRGPRVPADRKSLAYALRFRAPDRTLTDAEVDAAIERIAQAVRTRFGAVVRGAETEAT